MPPPDRKLTRAESARINGARSRGPKTPAGQAKCLRTATENARRRRAVALTHECTLLPNESRELLDEIAAAEFAYWQPACPTSIQLVHELIDINWRIKRLRFSQTNHLINDMESQRQRSSAPELTASMVANAEIEGSSSDGAQFQCDRRANLLAACRARILRDLERLQKRFPAPTGSQIVLETQHFSTEFSFQGPNEPPATNPEPELGLRYATDPKKQFAAAPEQEPVTQNTPQNITEWAQSTLGFTPDTVQQQILTETNKRILVLAPRQTGKSTAAAVRVLHEVVHNPKAVVLLASASGRQSGQILQKTRQMAQQLEIKLSAPPSQCDGFTLPNGAAVVALPDSQETIRGFSAPTLIIVDEAAFASDTLYRALEPMLTVSNGTLMLLSTPNGQLGYFYDQWHLEPTPWARIFGTLADCPRVSPEAIERIKASMSKEDFQQEFECKFVCAGGQYISMETIRKCLRDDFEPFCPEWDRE